MPKPTAAKLANKLSPSKLWQQSRFILFMLCLFAFRSAIADWSDVPTGSMKPTVQEGDRVLINKMAYGVRLPFSGTVLFETGLPQRGDIVVFDSEIADKRLLKRIIALPGDRVALKNHRLFINGQALEYQYDEQGQLIESILGREHALNIEQAHSRFSEFDELLVPAGHYLYLGDNRNHSADSRVYGFMPREELRGRVHRVAFSLNYENYFLPRADRFLKGLD